MHRRAGSLVAPEPALIRAAMVNRVPAPAIPSAPGRKYRSRRLGAVVVQIGAFSNEANAERAWMEPPAHYGLRRRPLTTTIQINGRTLNRVAIRASRPGDAQRLCGQIRAQGGACFVRGNAGDASIRWAARYSRNG